MTRGYANRGTADRGYIGAIAELLCQYPRVMATACAHPFTGVVVTTKFLPTPADIVEWIEPHMGTMRRNLEWEERAEQGLRARRDKSREKKVVLGSNLPADARCNLLIRAGRHRYAEMCERAKTAEPRDYHYVDGGIWVDQNWWWEDAVRVPYFKTTSSEELLAHYGVREETPA